MIAIFKAHAKPLWLLALGSPPLQKKSYATGSQLMVLKFVGYLLSRGTIIWCS